MTLQRSILILFFLLGISSSHAEMDTLASVIIKNPIKTSPNSMEFQLYLMNNSWKWDRWANGTFQLHFQNPENKINSDDFSIKCVSPINTIIKTLPDTSYNHYLKISDSSFVINILGPANYEDCIHIPKDSIISLGKYRIKSIKGNFTSDSITWKKPYYIYQACAYKAKKDSNVNNHIIWHKKDDNIEMADRQKTITTKYSIEYLPPPEFILDHFLVDYMGDGIVELKWTTESEAYNKGFIVSRYEYHKKTKRFDLSSEKIIVNYNTNPDFRGCDNYNGRAYPIIKDTLPKEDKEYSYILKYMDYSDKINALDTAFIYYPLSIISFAQPNPNPFSSSTCIEYIAEDNVRIDAKIYNIKGKMIASIYDNKFLEKGNHYFDISADQLGSSGYYQMIIIVHPENNSNTYKNKVVIDLHLLN